MSEFLQNIKFIQGAILPEVFTQLNNNRGKRLQSGAYSVFIGQVRNDQKENQFVQAIEYTSNEALALNAFQLIVNDAAQKFKLQEVHILHSLGIVNAGDICLFVQVCAGHRKDSFPACEYIVERLKKEVPIWGKEILENQKHIWKINK